MVHLIKCASQVSGSPFKATTICPLTSVYHRWCEKLGAKINARFSQLSWYYADVGANVGAIVGANVGADVGAKKLLGRFSISVISWSI